MTETATEYRATYTRADVDALRKDDRETIERLTKEAIAREDDVRELREDLLNSERVIKGFAADITELREERERAKQSMEKMQAKIDEQACTITAIAVERDALRHTKMHLEYRLEEYKKRVEMAAKCLGHDYLSAGHQVELALMVLEEKDLRRECESCNGPCNVQGDTCLLCGAMQPKITDEDICPRRE